MLRPATDFRHGVLPKALAVQLHALGLPRKAAVLVHAALRAVGPIVGGAEGLLCALQDVVGESGTIMVPAFYWGATDPACWNQPPPPEELAAACAQLVPFAPDSPIATDLGVFPRVVHRAPDAQRSKHPAMSFVALGARAAEIAAAQGEDASRPLGCLERLAALAGWVLLRGVDFRVATSIHHAEERAGVPYVRRDPPKRYLIAPEKWIESARDYDCSQGFNVVVPVLQEREQLRQGQVGAARAHLVRHNDLVAAALSLLARDRAGLLCNRSGCVACARARRLLEAEGRGDARRKEA